MPVSRALALTLTLLTSFALSACGDGDGDGTGACDATQNMRIDDILALNPDEAAGATVFGSTCGSGGCHGADGSSGPAPSLAAKVPDYGDAGLTCALLTGPGGMPSQASLSDQELADVLAYVGATF